MAFSELRTKGLRVCAVFDAAKLLILPPHGFYSAYLFHASPENCTVLITAHCKTDTITIDPFFQCHIICVFRPKVQQFSINRNNPTNCTATKRTMSHHSKNCADYAMLQRWFAVRLMRWHTGRMQYATQTHDTQSFNKFHRRRGVLHTP